MRNADERAEILDIYKYSALSIKNRYETLCYTSIFIADFGYVTTDA